MARGQTHFNDRPLQFTIEVVVDPLTLRWTVGDLIFQVGDRFEGFGEHYRAHPCVFFVKERVYLFGHVHRAGIEGPFHVLFTVSFEVFVLQ